jgi:hypothetical protein
MHQIEDSSHAPDAPSDNNQVHGHIFFEVVLLSQCYFYHLTKTKERRKLARTLGVSAEKSYIQKLCNLWHKTPTFSDLATMVHTTMGSLNQEGLYGCLGVFLRAVLG